MEMTAERVARSDRIVHQVVRRWRYRIPDEEVDDLVQVAHLGLLTASEFEPDRGASFETFSWVVVNQALAKHWQKSFRRRQREERFFRMRRPSTLTTDPGFAEVELRDALDRLPERYRRLVAMRVSGCKQQDMATAEGISQMHVSRLLRAVVQELNDGLGMEP